MGYIIEIRKTNSNIPIIMFTDFGTPDNKISGFADLEMNLNTQKVTRANKFSGG